MDPRIPTYGSLPQTTYYHSGEWTKGRVMGSALLTGVGSLALITGVALLVLQHMHFSFDSFPLSTVPAAALYIVAGCGLGLILGGALFIQHIHKKTKEFAGSNPGQHFNDELNQFSQIHADHTMRSESYISETLGLLAVGYETRSELHYYADKAVQDQSMNKKENSLRRKST